MGEAAFLVLALVAAGLSVVVLPNILTKRAMRRVVGIFRDNNALSPRTAKSIRELKLEPRSLWMTLVAPRDYKPRALQYLMRANIVRSTEDGRVYLSQETLRQYNIEPRKR